MKVVLLMSLAISYTMLTVKMIVLFSTKYQPMLRAGLQQVTMMLETWFFLTASGLKQGVQVIVSNLATLFTWRSDNLQRGISLLIPN